MMGENMMTIKRLLGVLTVGLALMTLAACGQKSTESVIKNELKDSYTGYSENKSYEGLNFIEGSDTLVFDKKNNTITNSNGEVTYFSVISDDNVPSDVKAFLKKYDDELSKTDNFTIVIDTREKHPTLETGESLYQIALSDNGKKIRIFELRQDYDADGNFYDFTGTAN